MEYIFLVNATPDDDAVDAKGNPERVTPKAVEATIRLPDADRPLLDAVVGGSRSRVRQRPVMDWRARSVSGPGELRVFARTAVPLGIHGGVRLARPVVTRDLVQEQAPLQVRIAGSVVNDNRRPRSPARSLCTFR